MFPPIRKPIKPSTEQPRPKPRRRLATRAQVIIRDAFDAPTIGVSLHNPKNIRQFITVDNAVIDTGAQVTTIPQRLSKKLGLTKIGLIRNIGVEGDVVLRHTVGLRIKTGNNISKILEISAGEDSDEIILGMDWIGSIKPSFTYKTGLPPIKGQVIINIRDDTHTPTLRVSIHNHKNVIQGLFVDNAIIDTGSQISSISKRVANKLGLTKVGSVRVINIDGNVISRDTVGLLVVASDNNGEDVLKFLSVSVKERGGDEFLIGMDWIGTVQPSFVYTGRARNVRPR